MSQLRLAYYKQVRALVPFSRQWLSKLEKQGKFPKRVLVGERRVAWRLDEVEAWIAARPQRVPDCRT